MSNMSKASGLWVDTAAGALGGLAVFTGMTILSGWTALEPQLAAAGLVAGAVVLACRARRNQRPTHPTAEPANVPSAQNSGPICGAFSLAPEKALGATLESELSLVHILKHLRDEVYIFDAETLTFTYLNDAALRSVGWPFDRISEKSLKDLTPGFDEDRFRAMARPLLLNQTFQIKRMVVFNKRPYDADLQLIRNEDRPDQFVCVMRDATDRLEAESAKAEFISTVSHELRSPMTSIKGAMGLLLSGSAGEMSEKALNLVSIAQRNADRLVFLINDILDLEKLAANAMKFDNRPHDMAALIAESVAAIGPFSKICEVEITTRGLDRPVMATIDQNRIMQVLYNLLSNAIKFSHAGGKVVVELIATDEGLRVEVRDEGKGIPEDKQRGVFERFSPVSSDNNSRVRSTGLGLSIVKSIVEKQGGTVGFTSQENKGSTFFFQLPKDEGADDGLPRVAAE